MTIDKQPSPPVSMPLGNSLHLGWSFYRPYFQAHVTLHKPAGGRLLFSWDCGIPLITKWEQAQRREQPPTAVKLHYGDTRIEFKHGTSKGTLRTLSDGISARR